VIFLKTAPERTFFCEQWALKTAIFGAFLVERFYIGLHGASEIAPLGPSWRIRPEMKSDKISDHLWVVWTSISATIRGDIGEGWSLVFDLHRGTGRDKKEEGGMHRKTNRQTEAETRKRKILS